MLQWSSLNMTELFKKKIRQLISQYIHLRCSLENRIFKGERKRHRLVLENVDIVEVAEDGTF